MRLVWESEFFLLTSKFKFKTVLFLPSLDPSLIFPFHLLSSPVHPTGFSVYIFPGFLDIFILLSTNNNNLYSTIPISRPVVLVRYWWWWWLHITLEHVGRRRGSMEEFEGRRRGILSTGKWCNAVNNMWKKATPCEKGVEGGLGTTGLRIVKSLQPWGTGWHYCIPRERRIYKRNDTRVRCVCQNRTGKMYFGEDIQITSLICSFLGNNSEYICGKVCFIFPVVTVKKNRLLFSLL